MTREEPRQMTRDEIDRHVNRGIELLQTAQKVKITPWPKIAEKRRAALDLYSHKSSPRIGELVEAIGISAASINQLVHRYTGKKYNNGGVQILKGILERLELLDKND